MLIVQRLRGDLHTCSCCFTDVGLGSGWPCNPLVGALLVVEQGFKLVYLSFFGFQFSLVNGMDLIYICGLHPLLSHSRLVEWIQKVIT